jgi:hypothetical protein
MSKNITALLVNQTKEDGFLYEKLLDCSEGLKKKSSSYRKVKQTFYDEFQEGTKSSKYDFVVATFFDFAVTEDDVEMQDDIYNFYATAPVFVWVVPEGDEIDALKKLFKKSHEKSNVITFKEDENESKANALLQAFEWAEKQYNTLSQDVVKVTFAKYDVDKSGAIDKEEL